LMKLLSSCLLFAAFLVPFPIAAQQTPPPTIDEQVDRLAAEEMASLHEPSLAISIVNDGQLIFAKGYGLSDIENNVPATADTVYRIASLSKSLTATAAMRLVEEHKLDLAAPIQKYCPAFPTKQWPITVREVLTHQSGIRHYKNDDETINTRHYTSLTKHCPRISPSTRYRSSRARNSATRAMGTSCSAASWRALRAWIIQRTCIRASSSQQACPRPDWMMSSPSFRTVRMDTASIKMANCGTQSCSTSATSRRVAVSIRAPAILDSSW
jgi:CubicO group peptidase (beta-lactamase class C family)